MTELIKLLSYESEEEKKILKGETLDKNIYSDGADFVIDDIRLGGKNNGISVRTHTRYTPFPIHRHNYTEMMIVLSGRINHRIGEKRVSLGKGEILFLNKHISHSIEMAGKDDIGVNVIMSDSFLNSMSAELESTVFSGLMRESRKYNGDGMFLHFCTDGVKKIENLIENLLIDLTGERAELSLMAKTVELLLSYLSSESDRLLIDGTDTVDKATRRKLEILGYVKSNYRSASLGELSKKLYLSVPYLSKTVKESFGKSFKELLIDERMNRACEMIKNSDIPISDIIQAVGYENESYFHREFKKRYAATPLQLRKTGNK